MKKIALVCAATVMAVVMNACSQMPPDTRDSDIAALKANEVKMEQDYNSKDIDRIASHYADDAVMMLPGEPVVTGKSAIREANKPIVSDPAFALHFTAERVDVAKSSDLGYVQGTYNLTITQPLLKQIIQDHGTYVTVYKKQADGTWKVIEDIATSNAPMVPPPAPTPAKKR